VSATSTSWGRPALSGRSSTRREDPSDVVLLDLKLPDADALDGVASFASGNRSIVVFTAYDADDDVFRAIQGPGIPAQGSPAARLQAIRQVHAGESCLSPRIAGS
jgi:DNA-binding NarL/FixJ family response regulator